MSVCLFLFVLVRACKAQDYIRYSMLVVLAWMLASNIDLHLFAVREVSWVNNVT